MTCDGEERPGLRLNIGCGRHYRCGFVNVDSAPDVPADVCADASALPFDDECASRADYIHVLEHLEPEPALRTLSEAHRVLQPGGLLVLETPDPEGSFHAFLEDERPQRRAQLLSWVFGLAAPGYRHHLLYPRALLQVMLERAGFDDLRFVEPRYHRYAPGLRVEARRSGAAVHRLIALLRREVAERELLDLSDQLQALEFERRFFGTVLALGGADEEPMDPMADALDCVLLAPEAAACWIARCVDDGLDLPNVAQLQRVADAAVECGLRGRMDHLFEALCEGRTKPDDAVADGYLYLLGLGRAALAMAMASDAPVETLRRALLAPASPVSAGPLPPWTRALLERRVATLRGQGLQLLCRGKTQDGIERLRRAARSRIDPLYAHWNLAVAHSGAGDMDSAAAAYREALEWSPPETEDVLRRALTAAEQGDRSALRIRPVLEGEGLYHAPDLD